MSVAALKTVRQTARLRAWAFGLVSAALVAAFAIAESLTERYVSSHSRLAGTAIELTIVALAALGFRPLHQRVESLIEAALTRRRREAREALSHLQKELTSFTEVPQVLRRVVEGVDRYMSTAGSAIYLWRGAYAPEASTFESPLESVVSNDALTIRLRSSSAPADPRALRSAAAGELAFPMMARGELVGFLTLTPRRIEYDDADIQTLSSLTEATGTALITLDSELSLREQLRTNIPQSVTSFVGRETELAEIKALLQGHPFVTLTGAGGVGKTRTALKIGTELLDDFADGVWVADLASVSDGSHVPVTIVRALNLPQPVNRAPLDTLIGYLKRKRLLLVIDNCEHVIDDVRTIASAILRACPEVRLLATSRENFNITEEQIYRMPGLAVPSQGGELPGRDVLAFGAVRLFNDRAVAVDSRFEVTDENAPYISEICRRLDGIPLAIELAAARVKILSPQHLVQKLDERFRVLTGGSRTALPRQQTLHALIDWSHDLLSESERVLFRRLAIFAGGFTLDLAANVCSNDTIEDFEVMDLISALVDKSLVYSKTIVEETRYSLLESIRAYAREKLVSRGELEALTKAHALAYAKLAEQLESDYATMPEARWRALAEPELENFRVALTWAFAPNGDVLVGQRLTSALRPAWFLMPSQGRRWVAEALERVQSDTPRLAIGWLELTAAHLDMLALKNEAARPAAKRALDHFLLLNDINGVAMARLFLGGVLGLLGEAEEGEQILRAALMTFRERGSRREIGAALGYLALTRVRAGDLEGARPLLAEALEVYREIGALRPAAHIALSMAEVEYQSGNAYSAIRLAREALANDRELRDLDSVVFDLCNLGAYEVALERWRDSTLCALEALSLARDREIEVGAALAMHHLAAVAALRPAKNDEPERELRERAAGLIGYVDERFRKLGYRRDYTDQYEYDAVLRALDNTLGRKSRDALVAQGGTWNERRSINEIATLWRGGDWLKRER